MFGFGKKPAGRQDPEKLAQLTDHQLHLLFIEKNWYSMDKASRLAVLQEVENRRARLDGREPVRLEEGSREEFEKPESMGYYSDTERVIRVNYRFLEGASAAHSPMQALDTVVHEGRHAMQHDVVREHPDKVAIQILNEWRSSTAKYFAPPSKDDPDGARKFAIYAMQSIEIDARRTAREELLKLQAEFKAKGLNTRAIDAQIMRNLREEYAVIWLIQNKLTLEKLDELEKMVLAAMRERFPDVDVSKLRLFDHARILLKAPPIDRLKNPIELIALMDRYEREKLAAVEEKPLNKVDEKTDDKLDGKAANRIAGLKLR